MSEIEPASARVAGAWVRDVLARRRRRVVVAAVLFVGAAAAALVGPQLLGLLVDTVVAPSPDAQRRVDLLAVGFVVALLTASVLRGLAQGRTGVLGEDLLAANREQVVDRSLRLPLPTVERVGTGALLSRATTDLDRVDFAIRYALPTVLTSAVAVVLTLAAMVVTSPLLALATLAALPTLVAPTRRFLRRVPTVMATMLDRWAVVLSRTHESAAGARTLDGLGLLTRRRRADTDRLGEAVDGELGLRTLHVRWAPWLEISHALPLATVLLLGAVAHGHGLVGLGTVATMALYVQLLAAPLSELLWWSEDLLVASVALRRVLGIGAARTGDDHGPRPRAGGGERGLRIAGARFAYRADRPVLRGVDLDVPPGERLAIVGGSGAGKSTLARLVAGIAAPDAGSVRLDGDEVAALPEDERRRRVLLLTQEHHVFAGSLRDNLALPAGAFDDRELHHALRVAGLGDWAGALGDGLDTAPASPSASRSRGWCWPTRGPSCSTRPPRCSTPTPPAPPRGRCRGCSRDGR